ncbi:MAG TPA: DUF4349 domain-containing protein [Saprospiraceae bacterium]|nr:DUF4349 domain-containing protein [Saprospiraceae bacterium]
MSKNLILIVSVLLISSCRNHEEASQPSSDNNKTANKALILDYEFGSTPPRTMESPPPPELTLEKASKIIKTGFLKFQVNDLNSTKIKVDSLLKKSHGYYENEQFNSHSNRITYTLLLRIPNTHFDSLVKLFEQGIDRLEGKNINAKDVTEEYVDLNIRLNNHLAYLNQYKDILKKTNSIKEILEVQEKIRSLEEEIESKKGRLNYLDDKVKYSTLNLELTELITSTPSSESKFTTRLKSAFNDGFEGFLGFIVGVISLWPLLIVLLFIIISRKSIFKNLNFRKSNSPKDL